MLWFYEHYHFGRDRLYYRRQIPTSNVDAHAETANQWHILCVPIQGNVDI